MTCLRIPGAVYRLQFNRQFPFNSATKLVPYLYALGITDIYTSPLLEAKAGSTHGYDVTNPNSLNPELGGKDEFDRMDATLKLYNMGLLMDIVPNHMAASIENPWWLDVLRHGRESPFAHFFDINWDCSHPGLKNRVLLPVLGAPYGEVLENRQFSLLLERDGFWVSYHENRFPVSPKSYSYILGYGVKILEEQHSGALELKNLQDRFAGLPSRREERCYQNRFTEALEQLWKLYNSRDSIRAAIHESMELIRGVKGDPRNFDAMHGLLEQQVYRLAYWRVANQQINYRRFFDVSDKVSVRVEDETAFSATHALILELAKAGQVTGLRIDHIDGLYNPQEYLTRLQESLSPKGDTSVGSPSRPGYYVVAEKILGTGEELPARWPVYGTTGYDFLNTVNGLFVDKHESPALDRIYQRAVGFEVDFDELVYAQKRLVMAQLFAVEIENLTRELRNLAEQDRHARDLTFTQLEHGLREIIACFPVYRTYTRDYYVLRSDRKYIEFAIEEAIREYPDIGPACDFLRRLLLLDYPEYLTLGQKESWLKFVMRWQQFTGPIMAKGFEDTALYVYNQLVSLNEVGGDPRDAGITINEFHRRNNIRCKRLPHTLNATSTHDTKRSEDVRARINVLSEIPVLWGKRLRKWRSWNKSKKKIIEGQAVPGGNAELLIYQTLLGAWPFDDHEIPEFKERLAGYLIKSAREASIYTSWLFTNSDYENALVEFSRDILETDKENQFLRDFLDFQRVIAYYGALSSLAQVLLKITSPGVPDFYQGTELWNLSLVDPDNRRPVDFKFRCELLKELQKRESRGLVSLAGELLDSWHDGRIKMFTVYKALNFRRDYSDLFSEGEYIPLTVTGKNSGYVCAFARRYGKTWVLVAVPRLMARLAVFRRMQEEPAGLPPLKPPVGKSLWEGNFLIIPDYAPECWQNIFTGESLSALKGNTQKELSLSEVFNNFPVALLKGS
jgi:(1->4)-alpha-D-glucan 1-alpha-D-glucosylmutase